MAEIEAGGAKLVVVSADERADLDSLRERFALTFPMLTDPDLETAASYGVRQKDKEVALPATFIVSADRTVEFVHVAKNPVDRLRILRGTSGSRADDAHSFQMCDLRRTGPRNDRWPCLWHTAHAP